LPFIIFAALRDRGRATKKDDVWRGCVQVYLLVYGTIFQGSKHNSSHHATVISTRFGTRIWNLVVCPFFGLYHGTVYFIYIVPRI
jgi:hypothetical protein